jgi:DNA mismatch repair protein MutL
VAQVQVLPPALASQIAAGEVVERPASAVKELIENSLDAGAERCDITCDGGGVTRVCVADDGEGMSAEDARLSLERHATSKLRTIDDLTRIASYGFRGEALPSIASVSRLKLRTRQRGNADGVLVETEAGAEPRVTPAGVPVGTSVEVCDLFFNVPARRKFLRSTGTESSHVTNVVEGAALTRPSITFTLTRDGRRVREFLRAASRADRVAQLYEQESLVPVSGERGPVKVEAFLTRPERARPGAAGLWLIVNGRVVRDRMLAATIAQSFGSVIPAGNYPRGVVYLDMPPELLDVNVHPQKTEVRFVDPRACADAVYSIVSRELASALSIPLGSRGRVGARNPPPSAAATNPIWGKRPPEREIDCETAAASALVRSSSTPPRASEAALVRPSSAPPLGAEALVRASSAPPALSRSSSAPPSGSVPPLNVQDFNSTLPNVYVPTIHRIDMPEVATSSSRPPPALPIDDGAVRTRTSEPPEPNTEKIWSLNDSRPPAQENDRVKWAHLRFIAQLRQTFLLCEGDDGIYVLDQHAAAERVAFHRLVEQYRSRSSVSQTLLFPVTVELSESEVELVEQRLEDIAAVGLDVRVRGRQQVSVHAIPRLLQRATPERLVCDLVGEMARSAGRGFSAAIEHALSLMACHGCLRAGDTIAPAEAQSLLAALDTVDFSGHCAHGRPVVTVVSYHELERKVGRR